MGCSVVHPFSVDSQECGFVVHGSTQDNPINTITQGAMVTIGAQACATPCTLNAIIDLASGGAWEARPINLR
jgi:hypothetical protein